MPVPVVLRGYSAADHARTVGGCTLDMNPDRPRVREGLLTVICRLVLILDLHDVYFCGPGREAAVLIFLPGLGEIRALIEELRPYSNLSHSTGEMARFITIPLHSEVAREQHQAIFHRYRESTEPGTLHSSGVCRRELKSISPRRTVCLSAAYDNVACTAQRGNARSSWRQISPSHLSPCRSVSCNTRPLAYLQCIWFRCCSSFLIHSSWIMSQDVRYVIDVGVKVGAD
eukprot:SAG11_NODE_570_length_8454_cov_19.886655_8_plen_229_part_00